MDRTASQTISYQECQEASEAFASGIQRVFDWRKGDVLALCLPNSIHIPVATLGTLAAGGIVSPCNPAYTELEMAHQFRNSGAKALLTSADCADHVWRACEKAGIAAENVMLIGAEPNQHSRAKSWASIMEHGKVNQYRRPKINPKTDLAFLVYSSGTSGPPKGVRLSHYNMVSNLLQLYAIEQYNMTSDGSSTSGNIPAPGTQGDKILACLPFFHIFGLTMFVLSPIHIGVTTFIMEKFDIDRWCATVEAEQITFAYIVPPIALLLAKHPAATKYNLQSIRMTGSGGAPLDSELVSAVYKRTGVRIKQGYGLSETSPGACHLRWEDWEAGAGTVGWLLPNMEIMFCSPAPSEGNSMIPLPPGSTGELCLRGPNVFLGYHGNSEATQEALTTDGWFRTGDVGHIDSDQFIHITDRVKELIKYKGFQVAPAELEATLLEHPDVADSAVIGVEDPVRRTEVPRAYIVHATRKHYEAGDEEGRSIAAWLQTRLTDYKRLRGGVRFVESIPKSPSGKILRRLLKEQASKELKAKL